MKFIDYLINELKKLDTPKKIVLIDGEDLRMIEAAKKMAMTNKIKPILLFEGEMIEDPNFESINVLADEKQLATFAEQYVICRKNKETLEQAQKAVHSRVVYAMMMLHNNMCDGVVGGLKYPTADILRASFKVIGPKSGVKTISSLMVVHKNENTNYFADISVNVNPTSEQLVDIATNTLEFTNKMKVDEPKIAFLSFSTKKSAITPESEKIANATEAFNRKSELKATGEIQFDAAVDETIRLAKYKEKVYNGSANIFIFPDLNSGNIGYKIAQRLGGYGAIGPILVGLNKPVNDLSRGALVEDIYYTAIITALQAN